MGLLQLFLLCSYPIYLKVIQVLFSNLRQTHFGKGMYNFSHYRTILQPGKELTVIREG